MRLRSGHILLSVIFFLVSAYTVWNYLSIDLVAHNVPPPSPLQAPGHDEQPQQQQQQQKPEISQVLNGMIPPIPTERHPGPQPLPDTDAHPVAYLTNKARQAFEETLSQQSQTLEEAVREYRRRYGMPPPPHFDKWFELARSRQTQLVDEFDTIHALITPFWGLRPWTIRARAREALGFDNGLLGVAIRDHGIRFMEGGEEWQRNATRAMMEDFLRWLPDMDLAFNVHDEPRVVVPSEDLARLVARAREEARALNANIGLVNSFSRSANRDGESSSSAVAFDETKMTRFTSLHRQVAWPHSRMSCPPDSPARILEDHSHLDDDTSDDDKDSREKKEQDDDDVSAWALSELGFVHNATALADVCLAPSLARSYGFFDRPNFHSVVHDLFPIFSQSKLSPYSDIIYPSPWYWADRVPYREDKDVPWAEKTGSLYWRGSTTGAYSKNGGWRRHHRQRVMQKINSRGQAQILTLDAETDSASPIATRGERRSTSGSKSPWHAKQVPRGSYADLFDAHFSMIGQCEPADCNAQKQAFPLAPRAEQSAAWGFKYLLDMDGNAFSGRFHAFLRSRSLTFKMALFREWHDEWLRPWVHYVPVSLRGEEWLEVVRYFDEDEKRHEVAENAAKGEKRRRDEVGGGEAAKDEGRAHDERKAHDEEASDQKVPPSLGRRMADESREWAGRVLRKDDMEVWFFRLLLEYARVIDDNRANLGFDLPTAPP